MTWNRQSLPLTHEPRYSPARRASQQSFVLASSFVLAITNLSPPAFFVVWGGADHTAQPRQIVVRMRQSRYGCNITKTEESCQHTLLRSAARKPGSSFRSLTLHVHLGATRITRLWLPVHAHRVATPRSAAKEETLFSTIWGAQTVRWSTVNALPHRTGFAVAT
jgi:hypothetical protein